MIINNFQNIIILLFIKLLIFANYFIILENISNLTLLTLSMINAQYLV